jgi:hypothetical protein
MSYEALPLASDEKSGDLFGVYAIVSAVVQTS